MEKSSFQFVNKVSEIFVKVSVKVEISVKEISVKYHKSIFKNGAMHFFLLERY